MAVSTERPWYEGPRTRAQRRRGRRELIGAPSGVTAAAVLPFAVIAFFEVLNYLTRTGQTALRPDVLRVLPYVLIVPVAVFAIDRGMPRWSVPWAAVSVWGAQVVLREVVQRLASWAHLRAEITSAVTGFLLAAAVVAALLVAIRLAGRSGLLSLLFLACFLMAGVAGSVFLVPGVAATGTSLGWAAVLLAVQMAAVAIALRWALNGMWLGVWLLLGVVLASPVLVLLEIWIVRLGLADITYRQAALAWWPTQLLAAAAGVWNAFRSPWARRHAGEVDTA